MIIISIDSSGFVRRSNYKVYYLTEAWPIVLHVNHLKNMCFHCFYSTTFEYG